MGIILILHGPNLNLLGLREPGIYGPMTLDEINDRLKTAGSEMGVEVRTAQANGEGVLVDTLHDAMSWASGVVFNPGAYTHTSIALRDAVAAIGIPVVEVHLSNVYNREKFRHKMTRSMVGLGVRVRIMGVSRDQANAPVDSRMCALHSSRSSVS